MLKISMVRIKRGKRLRQYRVSQIESYKILMKLMEVALRLL